MRLDTRRECRSLHHNQGFVTVHGGCRCTLSFIRFQRMTLFKNDVGQFLAKGICEFHMTRTSFFEKSAGADAFGSVDALVWQHKVERADFFTQRTDLQAYMNLRAILRESNYIRHWTTTKFQHPNVSWRQCWLGMAAQMDSERAHFHDAPKMQSAFHRVDKCESYQTEIPMAKW